MRQWNLSEEVTRDGVKRVDMLPTSLSLSKYQVITPNLLWYVQFTNDTKDRVLFMSFLGRSMSVYILDCGY